MTPKNVQLLLTGDELMSGDIVDSNSAMIAQQLKDIGIEIKRKVTVADDLATLVSEIQYLSKTADILLINGGLGPTVDDLTAQALANATDSTLQENKEALNHLTFWCQKRGIPVSHPNIKQTILPNNCQIIANDVGSAVGFKTTFNQCDIYCTPGVPHELKRMMTQEIVPELAKQVLPHQQYKVIRFHVFGYGESSIQQLISTKIPDWPEDIELGFRAAMPFLEVKLTVKHNTNDLLLAKYQTKLRTLLGEHILEVINAEPQSMAEHVLYLLKQQSLKICTAESCTGGLIASQLTSVPGSSQCFEAGFVTYSNNMKSRMIDVNPDTIAAHGAVSEPVVIEMAQGAILQSEADIAIAVSGIAGPDGGTIEKPVGSVWVAWGNRDKIETKYFCIKGSRKYFQKMVTTRALDLVRRLLSNSQEFANYMKD